MNMFKPVKARNREEYLRLLTPERYEIISKIDQIILKVAPELKPNFIYNMLGYGSFEYTNYKKELIDWPIIALASQKNYVSIYVCCIVNNRYLAEEYKDKLGKVSVGKSCIRFKKISDLNLEVLIELIKKASKNPGLT